MVDGNVKVERTVLGKIRKHEFHEGVYDHGDKQNSNDDANP